MKSLFAVRQITIDNKELLFHINKGKLSICKEETVLIEWREPGISAFCEYFVRKNENEYEHGLIIGKNDGSIELHKNQVDVKDHDVIVEKDNCAIVFIDCIIINNDLIVASGNKQNTIKIYNFAKKCIKIINLDDPINMIKFMTIEGTNILVILYDDNSKIKNFLV